MPFNGFLLDLDHTLYDYNQAHRKALTESIAMLSVRLSRPAAQLEQEYDRARAEIHHELEGQASSHSRLLYFQRLCENLRTNPCLFAPQAEETYWQAFLASMELRAGVAEFLDCISNTPVAIVTDLTAQIQFRKIARLGLSGQVSAIVSSEEAGRDKPHPRIFQLALMKLGITAENACMVGDSYEKDIRGALALGIRAFWLNCDPGQRLHVANETEHVVQFQSFRELQDLVATIG